MAKQFDNIKYKKALDFSFVYYKDKYRKGIKTPYFTYLSSVSNLIIENNGSTDEAISGLFHDIFDDENGIKKKNSIKLKFGSRVLNIVKQCSNPGYLENNKDLWVQNKKKFLDSMNKKSQSSLLVSICDKLHGVNCIISDHNKIGKKIWRNHRIEAPTLCWYYKSLCKNFKKYLNNHKNLKDKFQRNINELNYLCRK